MIQTLLDNLSKGIDERQTISALRQEIKDEDKLNELVDALFDDGSILIKELKNEDAKTRKNAALLMGELELDDFLMPLYEAYKSEEQLFVRSSYLTAISHYDYNELLPDLHKALNELAKKPVTEENRKHINEELRALSKLITDEEGTTKHTFTGYNNVHDCILLTNRLHADVTLEQISAPKKELFAAGIRVTTADLNELLSIRTYNELLFSISGIKTCEPDPIKAAKMIADSHLMDSLKCDHLEDSPFYFRVELKSSLTSDKKSNFVKKMSAELERITRRYLINSPSDYEIELRLIENKEGRLNVLVKYNTIPDNRFSYRKESVAASIKPVNAALLVELASEYMTENAQVLDPFCGVGTMLIERQMKVKANTSYGIDIYEPAIIKAEENTSSAGQIIHYINKDFFDFKHEYLFDEIFTNMPFSSGHTTEDDIYDLYQKFFAKSREVLKEHGTIIMYTHNIDFANEFARKNNITLLKQIEILKKAGTNLAVYRL